MSLFDKRSRDGFGFCLLHVSNTDRRALICQGQSDSFPNPCRATCDNGNFTFELHHLTST